MQKLLRTQQVKIKKGHRMYPYLDRICLGTKNLYNVGNFYIRQCLTGLRVGEKTGLKDKEVKKVSRKNNKSKYCLCFILL